MTMALLPGWLRAAWTIVLCAVVVLHAGHAWHARGAGRRWHAVHIVMALAMIAMYTTPARAGLAWAQVVIFAVVAVASGMAAARRRSTAAVGGETVHGRLWVWAWAAAAADSAAMCLMLVQSVHPIVPVLVLPLNYLAVVYLCVEMALWVRGASVAVKVPAPQAVPTEATPRHEPMTEEHGVSLPVRLTLTAMSASMAWMVIAMLGMQVTMGM